MPYESFKSSHQLSIRGIVQDPRSGAWRYVIQVRRIMLDTASADAASASTRDAAPKSNKQRFLDECGPIDQPFGSPWTRRGSISQAGKLYTIRRSYAEFKKLYTAVTPLMSSSEVLPKLPAQSLFAYFAGETQALLEKRRVALDRVLKAIENHSVASDSSAFLEFVADTEHYEQFHDAPVSPPPASHISFTFESRNIVAPAASLDSELSSRRRNSQLAVPQQSLVPNRERKARRHTIECPTENCVEFARYTML
ncbi:hypothetical protein PINS_up005421 [Pythium insidiosum]|nr:hypothetical protein PINS_up005421 [Pythium insidiosum]